MPETPLESGDYEDNDIDELETQCHETDGHPSEVIESGRSFISTSLVRFWILIMPAIMTQALLSMHSINGGQMHAKLYLCMYAVD